MTFKTLKYSTLQTSTTDTFALFQVKIQTLLRSRNGQECEVFHKVRTGLRAYVLVWTPSAKSIEIGLNSRFCTIYARLGRHFDVVRTLLRPFSRPFPAFRGGEVWTLLRDVSALIITDFPKWDDLFKAQQLQVRTLLRTVFRPLSARFGDEKYVVRTLLRY
jgi:hypothetical protein